MDVNLCSAFVVELKTAIFGNEVAGGDAVSLVRLDRVRRHAILHI